MNISSLNSVSVNSNNFSSRVGMVAPAMLKPVSPKITKSGINAFKDMKVVKWILEHGKKIKDGVQKFFEEGFGKKVIDFFKSGFDAVKKFFTPKKASEAAPKV